MCSFDDSLRAIHFTPVIKSDYKRFERANVFNGGQNNNKKLDSEIEGYLRWVVLKNRSYIPWTFFISSECPSFILTDPLTEAYSINHSGDIWEYCIMKLFPVFKRVM